MKKFALAAAMLLAAFVCNATGGHARGSRGRRQRRRYRHGTDRGEPPVQDPAFRNRRAGEKTAFRRARQGNALPPAIRPGGRGRMDQDRSLWPHRRQDRSRRCRRQSRTDTRRFGLGVYAIPARTAGRRPASSIWMPSGRQEASTADCGATAIPNPRGSGATNAALPRTVSLLQPTEDTEEQR